MAKEITGGRFRQKRYNFAMVSNNPLHDDELSLRARGLYATIQSYITIPNFTLYKAYLQRHCPEGQAAFNSVWKELKERGYLKQYRLQDCESKQFFWEYELLDEPEIDIPKSEEISKIQEQNRHKEPYPEKPSMAQPSMAQPLMAQPLMEKPCYGKQADNNNIVPSNIIPNNTVPTHTVSNHISLSAIHEQIGYDLFTTQIEQVGELCLIMQEVYSMPDGLKIRIAQREIDTFYIKERFQMLTSSHIEYVLTMLDKGFSDVRNMKSYLLTCLYNAPLTMSNYYSNAVAYDMAAY